MAVKPNLRILLVFALLFAERVASEDDAAALAAEAEDECASAEEGSSPAADCALSALQRRSEKKVSAHDAQQAAAAAASASFSEEQVRAALGEAAELQAAESAAEARAERARALLSPRYRYNSSAPGALRAPLVATQYDGFQDHRAFQVSADAYGETHIFGIGDWGATLPGHYTAPNKRGHGHKCPGNCDYFPAIDARAQILVANVMKQRAGTSNPQYVLNVGDNFYWAGINEVCNDNTADGLTFKDFNEAWKGVYGSLTSKPWISCLGNHDYGGRQFNNGWPQQIGYSFVNNNWVMPGRFYNKVMQHPGYSVEYFIIDTNAFDAKTPEEDPEHNICSRQYNPGNANCASAGGPASVDACKDWFWSSYSQQKRWLTGKLAASTADWQVVVTHFPCETEAGFMAYLHNSLGLDLLVTGHRHEQVLYANSPMLGGMTCFVTGGGGGITSEHPTGGSMGSSQYGFFDMTLSKEKIFIESIALDGHVLQSTTVYPKARR